MAPKGGPKRSNEAIAPEAPTVKPSCKDIINLGVLVASSKSSAESFGACKITPPKGWKFEFPRDFEGLKVDVCHQKVHQLQEREEDVAFLVKSHQKWLQALKATLKSQPTVGSTVISLPELYRAVSRRGGFQRVSEERTWREVCKILQIPDKLNTAPASLKAIYQKHLCAYEDYMRASCQILKLNEDEWATRKETVGANIETAILADSELDLLEQAIPALLLNGPRNPNKFSPFPALDTALASVKWRSGAHAHQLLGPQDRRVSRGASYNTMMCDSCGKGHEEDKIIICEDCDKGFHCFCLCPPLDTIPEGDFVCAHCQIIRDDHSVFRKGDNMTVTEYEKLAEQVSTTHKLAGKANIQEVENQFFNLVENGEIPVEVQQGTLIEGKMPPVAVKENENPISDCDNTLAYINEEWNLSNVTGLDCSLLKYLDKEIEGTSKPEINFGMLFSSSHWHMDKHMLYSVNYNHSGAAKRWYTVPASAVPDFERVVKQELPVQFAKSPNALVNMNHFLSPRVLQAHKVPVYTISQEPGEFVVTFPGSYTSSFNAGFNCTESVKFAPADWLKYGQISEDRLQTYKTRPQFSFTKLLLNAAIKGKLTSEQAVSVWKELKRVIESEREWRYRVRHTGCFKASRIDQRIGMSPGAQDHEECAYSHCLLHLSAVTCKCSPRTFVSLKHADKLCKCEASNWKLLYRQSLAELEQILDGVYAQIPAGKAKSELKLKPIKATLKLKPKETRKEVDGELVPNTVNQTPEPRKSSPKLEKRASKSPKSRNKLATRESTMGEESLMETDVPTPGVQNSVLGGNDTSPKQESKEEVSLEEKKRKRDSVPLDPIPETQSLQAQKTSEPNDLDSAVPEPKRRRGNSGRGRRGRRSSTGSRPTPSKIIETEILPSSNEIQHVPLPNHTEAIPQKNSPEHQKSEEEQNRIAVESLVSKDENQTQTQILDTEMNEKTIQPPQNPPQVPRKKGRPPSVKIKRDEVNGPSVKKQKPSPKKVDKAAKSKEALKKDNAHDDKKNGTNLENEEAGPRKSRRKGLPTRGFSRQTPEISDKSEDENQEEATPKAPRTRAAQKKEEEAEIEEIVAKILIEDLPAAFLKQQPKQQTGANLDSKLPSETKKSTRQAARRNGNPSPSPDIMQGTKGNLFPSLHGPFDVNHAVDQMKTWHSQWSKKGEEVFEKGGAKPSEVDLLVQQAGQFLWADAQFQDGVPFLLERLKSAQVWAHKVSGFLKNKATYEEVEQALASAPIQVTGLAKLVEGVSSAQYWRTKFEVCTSNNGIIEFKDLEHLVYEGARLPIFFPELKELKERMIGGRALQAMILQAMPGEKSLEIKREPTPPPKIIERESRSKKRKSSEPQEESLPPQPVIGPQEITVEHLRSLKSKGTALKITSPEFRSLCEDLDGLENLQGQIKEALQGKPTMEVLTHLYEAAQKVALELPELKKVKKLMGDATNWIRKLQTMGSQRTPFKKQREFLHVGQRLQVLIPEVANFRQSIRIREYDDSVRKLLNGRPKLEHLEANLKSAAMYEVEDLESAQNVRDLLARIKIWQEEATSFQNRPERQSLSVLQDLVNDGNELKVRLELLDEVNKHLRKVESWQTYVQDILNQTKPEEKSSLEDIDTILAQYEGPDFRVELPEAQALMRRQAEAIMWTEKARLCLAKTVSKELQREYQDCIQEGEKLGLELSELNSLKRSIRALDWVDTVKGLNLKFKRRKFVRKGGDSPKQTNSQTEKTTIKNIVEALPQANVSESPQSSLGVKREIIQNASPEQEDTMQIEPPTEVISQSLNQGNEDYPELEPLHKNLNSPPQSPKRLFGEIGSLPSESEPPSKKQAIANFYGDIIAAGRTENQVSQEVGSDKAITTQEEEIVTEEDLSEIPKLGMDQAKQLLEDGLNLPVPQDLIDALKFNIALVHDWQDKLAALSRSKEEGKAVVLDKNVLEGLVNEARSLVPQPEQLAALEEQLKKSEAWSARALRLFKDGQLVLEKNPEGRDTVEFKRHASVPRPRFSEVAAIAQSGRELMVRADAQQPLEAVVEAVELWRSNTYNLISKRTNQGHKLPKTLQSIQNGLNNASRELTKRLQRESARTDENEDESDSGSENEEDDEKALHCCCQSSSATDTIMTECDLCNTWYHHKCVGLEGKQNAKSLRKYTCPVCKAAKGDTKDLQHTMARVRKTRKVHVNELHRAQSEADLLPCAVEETEPISQIKDTAVSFAHRIRDLLEQHQNNLEAADLEAYKNAGCPDGDLPQPMDTDEGENTRETKRDDSPMRDISNAVNDGQKDVEGGPQENESPSNESLKNGESLKKPLRIQTLRQLLKSSISIEVELDNLESDILMALQLLTWRNHAKTVFRPGGKPTVEQMEQTMKEAEELDVLDSLFARPFAKTQSQYSKWYARARIALGVLNAKTKRSNPAEVKAQVNIARELVKEAEVFEKTTYPKGFEKDLGMLSERCQTYCLCEMPYDDDQPMLGCDKCEDWFHYNCVGLRNPRHDEDDNDVAPKDYVCPRCCLKENREYTHELPEGSMQALGLAPPKAPVEPPLPSGPLGLTLSVESILNHQGFALGNAQNPGPAPSQPGWLVLPNPPPNFGWYTSN